MERTESHNERAAELGAHPEHPARERLEWALAVSRVLLVGGSLLAVMLQAQRPPHYPLIPISLSIYLGYSVAILALVWRPLGFARGWAVGLHLFDLAAFSWLTLIAGNMIGPFFVSYIFLAICGTIRWQMWGAIGTGAISIVAMTAGIWLPNPVVGVPPAEFDRLLIRSAQLAIMAGLLGYLGSYHHRFQQEIGRLTSWPRRIPEDQQTLVTEVVSECARILDMPRVVLVWEEPGDGHVSLAWMTTTATVSWSQEPEGAYESLVVPRLEQASFQTLDAANGGGRVVYRLQGGGFRHCTCRPLNEALRARFDVAAVQSWPLEGELVHGRLFALDKPRMDIDALSVGELVARIAASRLDGLYMLRELGRAAALDERVKVASDLHDSLLQSLAGVALQLLVARRLIGRDPAAAAGQLDEIQKQIEQGELETRSFIRRLRPRTAGVSGVSPAGLAERLEGLGRRIERQWSVKVKTQVEGTPDRWPDGLGDEVFRVAREGILNAARHADASLVTVQLGAVDSTLRLEIVDDGGGFPFHGTFDLGALERMDQGPWSVKERVHALRGKLELTSTDSGSRLLITVPCAAKAG